MCVLVYVAFRFNICIESYNFLKMASGEANVMAAVFLLADMYLKNVVITFKMIAMSETPY